MRHWRRRSSPRYDVSISFPPPQRSVWSLHLSPRDERDGWKLFGREIIHVPFSVELSKGKKWLVQKKKWNWFVRKRKEREREKRAFAYFLFLSFHLPDLISTCCNLIKNYERWGGKEVCVGYTRVSFYTGVVVFFPTGIRESQRKKIKRKRKWCKRILRWAPLLPRFSFLNGKWKLRLPNRYRIHRIVVQRPLSWLYHSTLIRHSTWLVCPLNYIDAELRDVHLQEPFQELIIKIISRGIKEKRNPHETLTTTRWWSSILFFSFLFFLNGWK